VDPVGLHAGVPQQRKQLSASAAYVEHRRRRTKVVDVAALSFADRFDASAHPALEREVVGQDRSGRLGRYIHRRRWRRPFTDRTPFESRQALLELSNEALRLL